MSEHRSENSMTYDFFQPEDKTEVHLSRQAFTNGSSQAAGKLVPEHETSESRPHRPRSLLKPLTEYHFSAPICVELHKVLTRMVLAFGGVLFSLTSGRCSDTSQTYRGLSARALLITLLLDSEAAFDIDHPIEGPMRLDEIVLWELLPLLPQGFFVTQWMMMSGFSNLHQIAFKGSDEPRQFL
ncbi:hypothetical protein PAPYR_12800 [Paratrimastix pyriformis]|uniref:Uncharacterized protein n=1 Tax=Paratrimastix pyriformis TaxID=342808 RepID=A0ABQ8U1A6_9EUKA|nr:hypothetical protein PAPYR_12800 [Paratrimastix pyriformis]